MDRVMYECAQSMPIVSSGIFIPYFARFNVVNFCDFTKFAKFSFQRMFFPIINRKMLSKLQNFNHEVFDFE